ncbi:MAG: WD40 repeat domain-containing protein [Pirellulales bacterium]
MPVDPTKTALVSQYKHTSPLISCRIDPTGTYAFAGAQDNTIVRWELADPEKKPTLLVGHGTWVRALGFSPDGATLFAGAYDGQLLWWPVAGDEPKPQRAVAAHTGWVRALAVSPDGKLVATCGNDNLVKLWNAADGALVREQPGHASHVYNVAFHPGGGVMASADLKGIVKIWNVADGAEIRQLEAPELHKYDATFCADIGGARAMQFSPDGKLLAAGGMTNCSNAFAGIGNPLVVVFDWEQGQPAGQHKGQEAINAVIWGLAFHPDGFLMGASGGGSGGRLFFWKHGTPDEFFKLQLPNTARDLAMHPDQQRVAIAHHDSTLRLYRIDAPVA